MRGVASSEAKRRAQALLERVGLGHRARLRPAHLSTGECQRVAVARALANDPSVIFADEPTGNLDTANGHAIIELLKQLNRDTGKTFIIVTHDPNIAAQCHRTVHIVDGLLATEREFVQRDGGEPARALESCGGGQ
jgi:predicted ABC-type transport system involved in lysophospholipase L1 biosynthesis ATPase subunit